MSCTVRDCTCACTTGPYTPCDVAGGCGTTHGTDSASVDRCGLACAYPERDGRLCERRCGPLYLRDLRAIPELYHRLGPDHVDQHMLPGAASGPKVSGSKAPPLPARGGALNLRGPAAQRELSKHHILESARRRGLSEDAALRLTEHLADQAGQQPLVDVLATVIREMRPYLGSNYRLNQGTLDDQIRRHTIWLDRNYERYATHPEMVHLAELVRAAAHHARAELGDYDAPVDEKPVPCQRCDHLTLVQEPGEDDIVCTNPDCRAVYYPHEYVQWVKLYAAWADGQTELGESA